MIDYQSQAEMLNTWTAQEVKAQPEVAVGQLRSAATAIERLGAEVDRLNRENFWLTQEQKKQETGEGRMIRVPPLQRGDVAYGICRRGGNLYVTHGKVTQVEIVGENVQIHVNSVGCGFYGEKVFKTKEDAQQALERMKEGST